MTDTAAAETAPPAAVAQTKAPSKKKKAAPRSGPAGPRLGDQILKVVADGKDRRGMSLAAIKKALAAKGVDVEKRGFQIRSSIKKNVMNGSLKQIKGTGASGSFKIANTDPQGKVGKKVKKPAAKKSPAKKAAAKKSPAKKAAAKKSPAKKATAKKSPAKKAAAKKSPAKKAAAKKSPAKKATAKKSPAKKAAAKKTSTKKALTTKKTAKGPAGKKAAAKKPKSLKKVKAAKKGGEPEGQGNVQISKSQESSAQKKIKRQLLNISTQRLFSEPPTPLRKELIPESNNPCPGLRFQIEIIENDPGIPGDSLALAAPHRAPSVCTHPSPSVCTHPSPSVGTHPSPSAYNKTQRMGCPAGLTVTGI
uniref:histone H1-like n=1 Tax=Pristiophorus japonicus TaxID=55135 RepID=UPI00398EEF04